MSATEFTRGEWIAVRVDTDGDGLWIVVQKEPDAVHHGVFAALPPHVIADVGWDIDPEAEANARLIAAASAALEKAAIQR